MLGRSTTPGVPPMSFCTFFAFGVIVAALLSNAVAFVEVSTSEELAMAIESARPGEVIEVQPGRYSGVCGFELNGSFTISGVGQVFLDCGGQDSQLSVIGDAQIRLNNLAFVDGYSDANGGCIEVSDDASLEMIACLFSRCVATNRGGGVFVRPAGKLILRQTTFSECSAGQGGALSVEGPDASVSIEGCNLFFNSANEGGGLLIESASLEVQGSTVFQGNNAARGGAIAATHGIHSTDPCAILLGDGTLFQENVAEEESGSGLVAKGGAIHFVGSGSLMATTVSFVGNIAFSDESMGGALYIDGPVTMLMTGAANITHSVALTGGGMWIGGGAHVELRDGPMISHNVAPINGGGALFAVGSGTVIHLERNVRVEDNTAVLGGGIVMAQGPVLNMFHDIYLVNNRASESGGGMLIYFQNDVNTRGRVGIRDNHAGLDGGGIYMYTYCFANLTEGTSITGNTCREQGAGVAVLQGVTLLADRVEISENAAATSTSGSGGGVVCQGCTMHLSHCHFTRNVAPVAAAVSWTGGGTCRHTLFEHNVAVVGGGVGHFSVDPVMLHSNSFLNNSATRHGGCLLISEASALSLSDSTFNNCTAGGNGAAVLVEAGGSLKISGRVSMRDGSAGGAGGAVHHQGKLLDIEPGAMVILHRNIAKGGGGISTTAEVTIEGHLHILNNVAREGDGGGLQAMGVRAVVSISSEALLQVEKNRAAAANGGGIALLQNARLALSLPACPVSCAGLSNGICDPLCMSPECGWDAGECADRFLEAGAQATQACERDSNGCPFYSTSATSQVCSAGCLSSSCEWGFGSESCASAVDAIGMCPFMTALIYHAVVNTGVRYIKEGGTAGGFGRCAGNTCRPANASIGRDDPYCTAINDRGRVWKLDCAECVSAHDTGEEAWGPCADPTKPRLPHVGFDYEPDELLPIANMEILAVLRRFSNCGFHLLAIRGNQAALAGGGVYKDRCDPFLEGDDRCFLGELDNKRLPSVVIDVADNSAGGPGGGVFVQCSQLSACLRSMAAPAGLPQHGNASERLVHFGDKSHAAAYGREIAGLPMRLEIVSTPQNYTPGQSLIDTSFHLLDDHGQVVFGSESWPNPHVVEVSVCRVGVKCRAVQALQPPFLLRSHATDRASTIRSAVEALTVCPSRDRRVEIHLQVAGDGVPGLLTSTVAGCDPCGPGQEMLLSGEEDEEVWTCRSCEPSTYVVTPLGGCQPCPLEGVSCDGLALTPHVEGAEWEVENATMRLQSCPAGHVLVRNPSVPVLDACVMCPPGKFSIHPARYPVSLAVTNAADAALLCEECVQGADCLGGADIVSLPGFWEDRDARGSSPSKVMLYQCPPRACEGNNTCSAGRHGVVCARCNDKWSKSGLECVHCGDETAIGKPAHIVSFVVTLVAACVAMYFLTWRPLLQDYEHAVTAQLGCSFGANREGEHTEDPRSRLGTLWRHLSSIQWTSPAMIGAFKVAVSFYQVASTFNFTFRIDWPESFNLVFSIGRLTGLDLTLLLPSVACISQTYTYVERLLIFTAAFPVTITLLLCLPYLLTCLLGILYHDGSRCHPKHDTMQRFCLRAVLLWFFLIYPTVSEQSLASFLCHDLGSGGHVLVMDVRVDCLWGGSSPSGGFYLALFLVLLYPIGIPAFFYYTVSSFFVPAMAEAKYRRALFSELIKLYRRETSTPVTIKLAQHFGVVRADSNITSTPPARSTPMTPRSALPPPPSRGESETRSEAAVPLRSFKRRVSQLFTQSFLTRELSGTVPEPALYDKLQHVLEQFGCSDEDLLKVATVLQRLSIQTAVSDELDGFEQLALKITHNHFLFTGHESLNDLSMEQLRALFLFDWEGLNRKRSDREIRKRKARRQQSLSSMDRDQLRGWVSNKARELETASRITVPNLNWNGESEEEDRALGFVGFLFDDFRVQTWWFFLFGEFCKLIMTSVLVFIPGQFWEQLGWGFFVQVCITALYVTHHPMAEQWLNDFQCYSLCLQSGILFFGVLLAFQEEQGENIAFRPWATLLVVLKWSLPFFPLIVMLLRKSARAVQMRVRQLVQGEEAEREETEPSCIERILFPTATNSKVRHRLSSVLSEASNSPLSLHRNMSDAQLLGIPYASPPSARKRTAAISDCRTISTPDAQLSAHFVSAQHEEASHVSEMLAETEAGPPPQPSSLLLPAAQPASRSAVCVPCDEVPAANEETEVYQIIEAAPVPLPPSPPPPAPPAPPPLKTELELSVVPTPRK